MCEVCLNKTFSNCPVCSDDNVPYINAELSIVNEVKQITFDCPHCGSYNEVNEVEDERVSDMKPRHDADFECTYCKTNLELNIYE